MNDTRTLSILQRVPVILAVTAASYGLTLHGRSDNAQLQLSKAPAQHGAQRAGETPRR